MLIKRLAVHLESSLAIVPRLAYLTPLHQTSLSWNFHEGNASVAFLLQRLKFEVKTDLVLCGQDSTNDITGRVT